MRFYALILGSLSLLFVSGCDSKDWSDAGYSDGFAVGYNTTCEIKATLIEGNWDNEEYSEAYEVGYADGAIACRNSDSWAGD